jgi:hypothetical protein
MSLSGTNVQMTTTTIPRIISVVANLCGDLADMIGTAVEEHIKNKENTDDTDDKDSNITEEYIVPSFRTFGLVSKYAGSAIERSLKNKGNTTKEKIAFWINVITDIIYTMEAISDQIIDTVFNQRKKKAVEDNKNPEEQKEKLSEIRQEYNIIKTTEYCLNLVVGLAGIVSVYVSAGKYRVSNLTVGPSEVSCDTAKVTEYSNTSVKTLSGGAGTTTTTDTNVEQPNELEAPSAGERN